MRVFVFAIILASATLASAQEPTKEVQPSISQAQIVAALTSEVKTLREQVAQLLQRVSAPSAAERTDREREAVDRAIAAAFTLVGDRCKVAKAKPVVLFASFNGEPVTLTGCVAR